MKKNIFWAMLLPAFLFLGLIVACDDNENQTVNLTINGEVGTQPFQFLTDYVSSTGHRYYFTKLSFYISNVKLVRADGTKELLKDVELFSFKTPVTISGEVPRDNYTAIEFGIGLDSLQNAGNPADFDPEHPQSYANAPYWGWASKYIFAQVEGKSASNTTDAPTQNFLYHTGLDSLYRIVTISKAIEVGADKVNADITMKVDKLFSGSYIIDMFNEPLSQTTDNYDLARRITDNFGTCFE